MEIVMAQIEHLQDVSKLFNLYRVFYQQASNLEEATQFLRERLETRDSTIFLAIDGETTAGFTQLYPSFSSVSMQRIWIINDLYVEEAYRQQGVAKLLMSRAEEFARETGAIRTQLSTQISNDTARSLYESRGYMRDQAFYHYSLSL